MSNIIIIIIIIIIIYKGAFEYSWNSEIPN